MLGNVLPLFLMGLSGGIVYGTWFSWLPVLPLLCLALLGALTFLRFKQTPSGAVWALVCLGLGLALGFADARLQSPIPPPNPSPSDPVQLEGRVSGFPEMRKDRIRFVMETVTFGKVRVTVPRPTPVAYGDHVLVQGRLKENRGFLNPGVFNHADRLKREGIFLRLYAKELRILAEGPFLPRRLDLARGSLISHLEQAFQPAPASLLKALLLGVTDMPDELRDQFNRSGAAHLLAVSGTHLSLLALVLFVLIRRSFLALPHRLYLGISQYLSASTVAILLTLPVLVLYCGLSGSRVPTVRSLVMILVFLGATLLGRSRNWKNAVSFAATVLLVGAPQALFDVSFQFTFVAVLVIGFGMSRWSGEESFSEVTAETPRGRRSGDYLKRLFLVSLVATVGLAPLTAYYFQNISVAAPLTNLLAMPLTGFLVIPLGLFHCLLHSMFGFDGLIQPLEASVRALLAVVRFCSAAPASAVSLSPPPVWGVVLCYLLFGILYRFRARPVLFVCVPLLLAIPVRCPKPELAMIDVGQGLCTMVRLPDERVVLFDTGGLRDFDVAGTVIEPFLRTRGIARVDLVVLSHTHPDHMGGLEQLVARMPVGEVWWNGEPSEELTRIRADHPQTLFRQVHRDDEMNGSTYQMRVLYPDPDFIALRPQRGGRDDRNNRSLVVRLDLYSTAILFPGDIRSEGESWMSARYPVDLDTDILVVPHHGGKESGDEIFLKAVSPSVALVSAGFGNRFGHPRPETLRRLSETGATLYRTDLDGAILIDHFQREPRLRTYWDLKMKPRKSLADEFRNFELALGFLR